MPSISPISHLLFIDDSLLLGWDSCLECNGIQVDFGSLLHYFGIEGESSKISYMLQSKDQKSNQAADQEYS